MFLISGDGHMHGAIQEAQEDGMLAVVVACRGSLSRKLKLAADCALHVSDLQAEAARLRKGQPPRSALPNWPPGGTVRMGPAPRPRRPRLGPPLSPTSPFR